MHVHIALVDGKVILVICEEEAKVVKMVFVWYTVGDGRGKLLIMGEIARRLEGTPIGFPGSDTGASGSDGARGGYHRASVIPR
jgi:hypothetical protein